MPILRGNVLSQSDIYTDGWKAYHGLVTSGFRHHRVHHHENEFARGKNHVNGIESFWSFAKHRLLKLHGIRKDKFLLHLKECEFRWNHRHHNLYLILLSNLRQHPLSYISPNYNILGSLLPCLTFIIIGFSGTFIGSLCLSRSTRVSGAITLTILGLIAGCFFWFVGAGFVGFSRASFTSFLYMELSLLFGALLNLGIQKVRNTAAQDAAANP